MKKQLYLMAIVLILFSPINAQTKRKVIKPNDVVIEGEIVDSLLSLTPNKMVEVTLSISQFPANAITAPREKYVLQVQYKKHFRFVVSPPADRFYMRIDFQPQGSKYWTFIDNIYILEKGDRITCKLSDSYFQFSGKGSAKLQCQSEIYKLHYKPDNIEAHFASAGQYDKEMEYIDHKRDSVFKLRMTAVNKYASKLGKDMTEIMIANCYGLRYYTWFRAQRFSLGNPKKIHAFLNSSAFKNNDHLALKQKFDPGILMASPNYCDFLFEKIRMESIRFKDGKIETSEENLKRIFDNINQNYSGIVKDKLLTTFLLAFQRSAFALIYLDEIISIIQNEDYKKILTDIKNSKGRGLPFYPFEMEDDKGKIVKLADFKDKVIILDFWYTGCINCVKLTEAMEPIVQNFKNDLRIQFVSVNIDKLKENWLNSIKSGKYTHTESINLYAGGKGSDSALANPLIKRYGIIAYPTVFIVKNSKMYESSPPIPSLSDHKNPNFGNTKKLISLIDEALRMN